MSAILGKKCTDIGKEYNPFTKRCNKKCDESKERIKDLRKKKIKCLKKCKPGSDRNTKTNRCAGQTRTRRRTSVSKASTSSSGSLGYFVNDNSDEWDTYFEMGKNKSQKRSKSRSNSRSNSQSNSQSKSLQYFYDDNSPIFNSNELRK